MSVINPAPGHPGSPAKWTSSAKHGVGTALTLRSRVWFTLSHGILNEIYYPRIDQACTRDFGLIVTDGQSFFSEEKRDCQCAIRPVADGVPAFSISSTCRSRRYQLTKTVLTDPHRDVVLQRVEFQPLTGALADYHLYALLAPHLVNRGAHNTAWIDEYKGMPMLFATGRGTALAVGCSMPFVARSAGFVGVSDGWQDLRQHFAMHWRYDQARDGNIALTGEVDLAACDGRFVLALGFGRRAEEAALRVRASLAADFAQVSADYTVGWQTWQDTLRPLDTHRQATHHNTYRVSTVVLRTHEAASFAGAYIASLSVPWGFSKGDEDLGGYHLVWPRDLVETAGGLLAAGAAEDARKVLGYLRDIQEADGHWPQNCWIDGGAYWNGVQMDECAFPILLADLAFREGALPEAGLRGLWPMVARAAGFIVRNGPVTGQDRWEEDGGYSPFTLAVEIAALLAAADLAEKMAMPAQAAYLRDTADIWNSLIERWIYATGTTLANKLGVDGYYVRIAPPETADAASPLMGYVPIKNRPPQDSSEPAALMVSPDALALVRFGLRAPDDPRILNTIRVIDALLKVDLPAGPSWHRYNEDGYGEHEDGRPFDGTGVGRAWPLLTGERAHYELAAGDRPAAEKLLAALEGFASDGHLLPEQVWDAPDIPTLELFCGQPSGSAMPLVWAHAEHVKLLRSLADGRVFDMPPQPYQRYQVDKVASRHAVWRFNHKCSRLPAGGILRVETLATARIHWSIDAWRTVSDTPTSDTGFGVYFADIPTAELGVGGVVAFTFYWLDAERWEGVDYRMTVE
ncbi:MAG TPA: glucan 1,4-alpha-glucosidase [Gammaproteobacteria bacterium]|nr:glucan 1,4-alpha-glucosidase [Gammaproteobacteria bacterium]